MIDRGEGSYVHTTDGRRLFDGTAGLWHANVGHAHPELARAAYEQMLRTSHTFNLLDARKAISVTERQRFILRVRELTKAVAEAYYASREALGFPMLKRAAAGAGA